MSVMSHHVHVLTDNQRVKTTHNSEASQSTKQRHLNSTQQTVVSRSHRTHRVIYLDVFTQPCHPRGREYVFTQPCHPRDVFTQPYHPREVFTQPYHSRDVFTQPCHSRDVFTQPYHSREVFTQPYHPRDVFTQPCHPRGRIHSALPPT